jgi:DNA-binding MarR family transcriptional regulator
MIQDLDSKAKLILEAIYQNGGEADTSDIKSYTGIEKSGVVHYRLDEKLEPDGYVETRKVDRDGSALGVKMSELTSKGRNAVGGDPRRGFSYESLRASRSAPSRGRTA